VQKEPLTFRIGKDELVIRQRYEAVSILNDMLIAVWFIIGSVMFFSPSWTTAGTWCFVFGSVELLIRPVIRLGRQLHLQRLHGESGTPAPPHDVAQDY
jgi:hypothetical protein